jgi:hypothetical protein
MTNTMRQRLAVLAFMAGVTAYLLARASTEIAGGMGGVLEATVYGASAALGLKFMAADWAGLWGRAGRGEHTEA